jgi:hypothetical protein
MTWRPPGNIGRSLADFPAPVWPDFLECRISVALNAGQCRGGRRHHLDAPEATYAWIAAQVKAGRQSVGTPGQATFPVTPTAP